MLSEPIRTSSLRLLPASMPMLDAIVMDDRASLSRLLGGAAIADRWMHFPEAMAWVRDYLMEHPDEIGWWTYLVLHRRDHCLVGTCGFKGLPMPDGWVEIGYEIADAYQGQGLATELARALVDHAFGDRRVSGVQAHTLPEENASVRVLRKLDFEFAGAIHDPEDGIVWKWQLLRR